MRNNKNKEENFINESSDSKRTIEVNNKRSK